MKRNNCSIRIYPIGYTDPIGYTEEVCRGEIKACKYSAAKGNLCKYNIHFNCKNKEALADAATALIQRLQKKYLKKSVSHSGQKKVCQKG